MDPREEKPQGPFVGAPNPALRGAGPSEALPSEIISGPFRLNLVSNGNRIGQLGVTSGIDAGWCILVPAGQGVLMSMYYYRGNSFITLANDTKSYLSVSTGDYAGFYSWSSAYPAAVTHEGWLNSSYNHQNLSFYSASDGYLYFWNPYSVLTVEPIAA